MSAERLSRRRLLGGLGVAAPLAAATFGANEPASASPSSVVSFFGAHQAGIATPPPEHFAMLALDVTTTSAFTLRAALNRCSEAALRLTLGQSLGATANPYVPPVDSGEALDRGPENLTVTIGYGPGLFDHRFGLSTRRPHALHELPAFPGDDLDPALCGGDLLFQFCSDDPQVNFHAAHSIERLLAGVAATKYLHVGFGRTSATASGQETTRNLIGFKDGTDNLQRDTAEEYKVHVWANEGEPSFMHGGTYLVARKIRVHLESWTSTSLDAQEGIIGRFKASGAPLTGTREHDAPNLTAVDITGVHVIPDNAHIRVAGPAANGLHKILRRGFGFVDGVDPRSGHFAAGLHFVCFQRDPHAQFVRIQQNVATNDALANYLMTVGSAVVACPRGLQRGQGWGDQLFGE